MESLEGQFIGRYEILELLGEGGMARVYKALDTRLERPVAVKVIRKENFSPLIMVHVLKRFEREAKSLAQLSHPNIVKVIDYGEYQNAPYLVLEYLSGGTLKSRLGEQIPYQQAALFLLPIARALSYAHQRGVIHRDIKPSNILISESGEPMLADFGLVKILESSGKESLTSSGVAVGTPEYMAPEQGLGLSIDSRSDIYALGVVYFEMVTGNKPFAADTPMAILLKHVSEPLPRPKLLVPSLSDLAEQVLITALAKDPSDRYQEMEAFASALSMLASNQKTTPYPGSEVQIVNKSSSEIHDEKIAITPVRLVSNGDESKIQVRINRLESVIAESITAEDFDDIDSMLFKLETLGERGKQAAQRLRAEIIKARHASRQRDEKIDRLKKEIQQGIETEDFTQSEALLQSLVSLGPRGQDQAAALKGALDSARQQAVQRKAEVYRLTTLVERQVADEAWELVNQTLNQLKYLGAEGRTVADRWEAELKKVQQQSEQKGKEIARLLDSAERALTREDFKYAENLAVDLENLGEGGRQAAAGVRQGIQRQKDQAKQQEIEIARKVSQVKETIHAANFSQAEKLIASLKSGDPKAQLQAQHLETELNQAGRDAVASLADQPANSASKASSAPPQAYPAPYTAQEIIAKGGAAIPFFRRRWFLGVMILVVLGLCISSITILAVFLPPLLTPKTTPADGISAAGSALTATEEAVIALADMKPTIQPIETITPSPTKLPHTATSIPSSTETFTPSPTPKPVFEVKINIAAVNIRSGPGTVYSIIANRQLEDILEAVGRSAAGDWLVIILDAKTTGWISTKVIDFSLDASQLPIVSAPPTPVIMPTKPTTKDENQPQQPPPIWTVPPP